MIENICNSKNKINSFKIPETLQTQRGVYSLYNLVVTRNLKDEAAAIIASAAKPLNL